MSSHREAPEISKDPVADSADLYAFVSPDNPSTVTIVASYVPLQQPAGGPNFYEFGDDVLYEIHIDNDGDARADITYQFRFNTVLADIGVHDLFLYSTGQIKHLSDTTWNRKHFYSVTHTDKNGLPRVGRSATVYAAVFPSLPAGDYAVVGPDGSITAIVPVPANQVTSATWG